MPPDRRWARWAVGRAVRRPGLGILALCGFAGSLAVTVSASASRSSPSNALMPFLHLTRSSSPWVISLVFAVGMGLLTAAWIGMVSSLDRLAASEMRARFVVVIVGTIWTLPILIGPPLLSNDVFSYAAQGELANRGFDPTTVAPIALGSGPFLRAVDPIWRSTSAPYGPAWIRVSEWVANASGDDPRLAVWLFRLVAIIGVGLAAVGVAQMATRYGRSAATAMAFGIANPLVIVHLVGGAHNDAVMAGLLVLGISAAVRHSRWVAITLVALAALVKLPAALGLLFIGWHFAGSSAGLGRRTAGLGTVLAGAGAIALGTSVGFNVGLGWLGALRGTGGIQDTFSITTIVGLVAAGAISLVPGVGTAHGLVEVVRIVGLLGAGSTAAILVLRSGRTGIARASGLSILVLVLLGPVVWPWYFPAAFALLAASGLGRFRPACCVLCVAASLLVWPSRIGTIGILQDLGPLLRLGAVILVATAVVVAQARADQAREDTSHGPGVPNGPRPDLLDGVVPTL